MRRWHRWVGLVMVAPLLAWALTGLLFHWKPGWAAAYETLPGTTDEPILLGSIVPLDRAAASAGGHVLYRAELVATALGPIYRLAWHDPDGGALIDARTGAPLSPLDPAAAQTLAVAAAAHSKFPDRYGAVTSAHATDGTVAIDFAGGATIEVDRATGELAQHGHDTAWIDRLYRIHYLQWMGVRALDRVLGLAGLVLIWLLAGLGVALAVRGRRKAMDT